MGKTARRSSVEGGKASRKLDHPPPSSSSASSLNPVLTALFDSSRQTQPKVSSQAGNHPVQSITGAVRSDDLAINATELSENHDEEVQASLVKAQAQHPPSRKRRRLSSEDDIENKYLSRLGSSSHEHKKDSDSAVTRKRSVVRNDTSDSDDSDSVQHTTDPHSGSPSGPGTENVDADAQLVHESLTSQGTDTDLEKKARTVFLGNVSVEAIRSKTALRQLREHLGSFFAFLPKGEKSHTVESVRFRSTPYADASLPKRAAFAKRDLMDATAKATNAYAVYSTRVAAEEAVRRLDGTVALNRHIRVDSVTKPTEIHHRRCVFVGNLGFVDDDSKIKAAEASERGKRLRKARPPGDTEEGLWRQFQNAGTVESVRVVRDKVTRVGKGFAYVQFKDANSVEKALLFDGKKFPPLLPRKLRVARAKRLTKSALSSSGGKQAMQAHLRAGRGGHAQARASAGPIADRRAFSKKASFGQPVERKTQVKGAAPEGHRASRHDGKAGSRTKKSSRAKRTTRSLAYKRGAVRKH